jgi:hypothetical protein
LRIGQCFISCDEYPGVSHGKGLVEVWAVGERARLDVLDTERGHFAEEFALAELVPHRAGQLVGGAT